MKRHLLFASVLCMCMASKAEIIRPTFDSSSYTNTGNEAASKLVDDAGTSTKWGMSWSAGNTAWIIVQADHTILNGYELYNGGDTASQTGRRWKSWRIEGSTDKNSWTTIEEKTNAGMTTGNNAKNAYTISGNTAEYNYYRITVLENEGGSMIQMSDLKFDVTYTVLPEYEYDVWSAGLPASAHVTIKGTEVTPNGAWTVGGTYTSNTSSLTQNDVVVSGLAGGSVYTAVVDNDNHQINIEVKDLFVPATSTTDDAHEYVIKDALNRYPFINGSNNIWHTTTKGEASRFLFIESTTQPGLYYIYDKTAQKYYTHTSNTGTTVSATTSSSVKFSATKPSDEQGLWRFDTKGHIMPSTGDCTYGWNFTGGNGHPLNLWETSDSNSYWQILDPTAASLACAVTMFAEPGKEYMHKLIPEQGDVINDVEFGAGITGLQFCTDRRGKGHNYVYVKGTAPTEEGTYTYVVKSNAGNTTVTLTVSSYLPAPTPTMGWLSWNWFESWAKQDVLVENARAMKERGLVDAGYKYFILDDKWAIPTSQGATKATLTYDTAKFPAMQNGNNGFNDIMHGLGFRTGIYSDAGSHTCAGKYQPGSYGFERQHVEKFNEWGFDMVKYDFCNSEAAARVSYPPMGEAIRDINIKRKSEGNPRPMALNICEWGQNEPWKWGAEAGGQTWRCTYDSREVWMGNNSIVGVLSGADIMKNLWMYAGVNRFNDADMMMIGLHGCGSSSNYTPDHQRNAGGNLPNPLTVNQARSQMSIWSMLASPLTMCADFRANPASLDNPSATLPNPLISEDDLFTLMNPNIIAIDQDILGQQAEFMESLSAPNGASGYDVYVKDLSGNRRALAVVNRSASATLASKSISLTDLYLDGSSYYVKDVWTGKVKQVSGAIETGEIGISETKVYIISSEAMEEDDFSSFFQGGTTPEPEPTPDKVRYTIKLAEVDSDLYFTTTTVPDNNTTTYSIQTTPQEFYIEPTGTANVYTITAVNGDKVGLHPSNTWDFANVAGNWTIADIKGGVTTILKNANVGFGVDVAEAGKGVYTNKPDGKAGVKYKWIITPVSKNAVLSEVNGVWVAASLVDGEFGDNTVWYSLANQQTNQTGYLSTKYTNNGFLATNNTTKDTEDTGLWCVIGDATNGYRFYNKAEGPTKVLSNNDNTASGMVDASTTANTVFQFNERTAGGKIWNILDFGSTNNCWCGSGNKLGHWAADKALTDNNCRWIFNPETVEPIVPPVTPETSDLFSTEENPVFWGLKFNKAQVYISDKGIGNLAETSSNFVTGWALIGDADSFKLLDTNGNYLGVKNAVPNDGNKAEGPFCFVTNGASAETFKLLNNNGTTFEIARTSESGKSFNPWGGQKAGINIGFWNAGSDDNKLVRVDSENMEYFVNAEGALAFNKPSKHTLWYNEPAPTDYNGWQEYSLPIGNGEFGGSIFGGVGTDKITFNEKSLWQGTSTTQDNPNHGEYLKFGSIWVTDRSEGIANGVTDYVRYLDIDNAVAGVEYKGANNVKYTRTFIASQPAKAIIGEYKAEGDAKLDLTFSVVPGGQMVSCSTTKPSVSYNADGSATFNGKLALLSYAAQFTVKGDDGAVIEATDNGIRISNTSNVMLYVAGATDFDAWNNVSGQFTNGHAAQLPAEMRSIIESAAAKDFSTLRSESTAEYRTWMDRVNLDLEKDGQTANSDKTTKDLINAYTNNTGSIRNTAEGLFLEQLYYNYGRYLLISSNRYAPVPNNLQGLWVDTDSGHAPWNSDIHTNINIQMNYWPAEQNNLSELHMPLLDHIKSISTSPGCIQQAKNAGQTVGWVVNTESNLFGGMSRFKTNYTIANAWYCTHLWQHYRFTQDKQFLSDYFPVMWSAAQYWAERMQLASDGKYECPNEWSPEHGPDSQNATPHSQQLVNELFANTLEAIKILGNESSLEANWLTKIREVAAKSDSGLYTEEYAASSNWGTTYLAYGEPILKEWKYSAFNTSKAQNGHRHTSHLMCLYPFGQVSYFSKEGSENYNLAVAARNSLAQRSDASTGWAMGWRVNLWARALDGNHARTMLNNALVHAGSGVNYSSGGVYYNLWDAHTPFQIDGNFGVCAGISEMLIQSYDETIHLLPALPDAWTDGSISGLKAVGNFTVDQEWKAGKLTGADITSNAGGTLRVHYGDKVATIENTRRGETYHFDIVNNQLTYNLVDASIVTITDYIDEAHSGSNYDAEQIAKYKNLILKKK